MSFKQLKEKSANLKTWQWFALLYIVGFVSLVSVSYGIKLLMAGLP